MRVVIAGAGGSYSAASWEVTEKGRGLYTAVAVVPLDEGEIKFTFNVDYSKKILMPADARAKAVFTAITDPDIADGDMR